MLYQPFETVRLTDLALKTEICYKYINHIVAFGWKLFIRISVKMKIYDVHFPGRHHQTRQYNKRTTRNFFQKCKPRM